MRTTLASCAVCALLIAALSAALAVEPESAKEQAKTSARHSPAAAGKHDSRTVSVHVFNKDGKLVGPVESPKLVLSAAQWRRQLTGEQYRTLRVKDTEDAFCGDLLDNKKEGVYSCAGCGLPLFSSMAKFNSGTGWPSFFQPVANDNIETHPDLSDGTVRTEVKCVRCKGHLGHLFDDGPRPTGLRFCLNSASLNFTERDDLASLADPAAGNSDDSTADVATTDKGKTAKDRADGGAAETSLAGGGDGTAQSDASGGGKAAQDRTTAGGRNQQPRRSPAGTDATKEEKNMTETAVFAGGCFWCTEAAFQQLRGVSDVESGYAGGRQETASYEQVSTGSTGHAEAIRVTYDPATITYNQLLMVFFDAHDPTQLNRQGPDIGTQYRSAIFYANEEQKKAAEAKIKELTDKKAYSRRIVTKLEPLKAFYPAEQYHQDYVFYNPLQPYVQGHSIPKACAVQKKHPELIDPAKAVRPVGP
jgi:methionine-S-sulfoxide reductase/methionine-R-sulfoxide reductase